MTMHVQQLVSKGRCGLFVFTLANDPKVMCELLNLHMKLWFSHPVGSHSHSLVPCLQLFLLVLKCAQKCM